MTGSGVTMDLFLYTQLNGENSKLNLHFAVIPLRDLTDVNIALAAWTTQTIGP